MPRVLVVDHEPAVLRYTQKILEMHGFMAVVAKDGPEALATLENQDVDALLTDIVMPGMSGTELILKARRRRPDLRVCCMTALAEDPVLADFPFIKKPFGPGDLIETLQRAMETPLEPHKDDMLLMCLQQEMREAKAKWLDSLRELDGLISEVPNVTPQPDGSLPIDRACREKCAAYTKYKDAFEKYTNALSRSQAHATAQAKDDPKPAK